jgi:hypothetical protein
MKHLIIAALALAAAPAAATTLNLGLSNGGWIYTSYDTAGNVIANNIGSCGVDCVNNDDVPFWTASYTFSTVAGPYSLNQSNIAADDAAVLLVNGNRTAQAVGILGPGTGQFFFSPTDSSTSVDFFENGYSYSESNVISAGLVTFTWVVNNNNAGIFGTRLTDGPSSLVFSGSFTQAVPEPANWVMLITGFGLVGAAARRRRMLAA